MRNLYVTRCSRLFPFWVKPFVVYAHGPLLLFPARIDHSFVLSYYFKALDILDVVLLSLFPRLDML